MKYTKEFLIWYLTIRYYAYGTSFEFTNYIDVETYSSILFQIDLI